MRAFVAVPVVGKAVVEGLAAAQRALGSGTRLRLVPPHQLHFTLKFLGEIDDLRVEAARTALGRAAGGVDAFGLELSGVGAYPRPDAARVVWAGCGHGGDALVALAARVEAAFAASGFAAESRPFSAHLTLGRVREGSAGRVLAERIRQEGGRPFGTIQVAEVVLMRSVLSAAGADHTALGRVPLGTASPGSASG